jgi:hypothetical protein
LPLIKDIFIKVAWPNGKALDYESRDSRFDPWRDHTFAGELLGVTIFCSACLSRFFSSLQQPTLKDGLPSRPAAQDLSEPRSF